MEVDHAESVILGCPLEAEYAGRLKRELGWVPSRRWGNEPSPTEEFAKFNLLQEPHDFGARIVC